MLFFSMLERTLKTAWFAKASRKARISDRDLCKAIQQVALGQADDLGGGVFKKRLNENRHRSIVLAKAGEFWVFAYLFAKQDRANIEDDELVEVTPSAVRLRKRYLDPHERKKHARRAESEAA